MKKAIMIVLLFTAFTALVFSSGCATTRGVGQDIQSLGRGLEETAE